MKCSTCGSPMSRLFFHHSYKCPNNCDKLSAIKEPEDDDDLIICYYGNFNGPSRLPVAVGVCPDNGGAVWAFSRQKSDHHPYFFVFSIDDVMAYDVKEWKDYTFICSGAKILSSNHPLCISRFID